MPFFNLKREKISFHLNCCIFCNNSNFVTDIYVGNIRKTRL